MPVPDYQTVMLPLLRLASKRSPLTVRDAYDILSDEFSLSDTERSMLLPSGKQTIIRNRIGWAKTYLKKAGLLSYPSKGSLAITNRGQEVLTRNPENIDVDFLQQFPEFASFRKHGDVAGNAIDQHLPAEMVSTPEEALEAAHLEMKRQVLEDIIEKIKECPPQFFERLVVDTMVAMGYGGSVVDAGKAIGKSGDEGVDGVIKEDKLGLDLIYLQAKKWGEKVSRPEIQKFAGALQGKRARKGIFITTSDFTSEARDVVNNIDSKIVLVSGSELAALLWDHNVGLNVVERYEKKRIDLDYFPE